MTHLIGLIALGCGPQVHFTAWQRTPARPSGCQVRLLSTHIEAGYRVLGVLDIDAASVKRIPRDPEAFLKLVSPAVCRAGGDAVFPGVNGDGRYIQATVLEREEPEPSAPSQAVPEGDTHAPTSALTAQPGEPPC